MSYLLKKNHQACLLGLSALLVSACGVGRQASTAVPNAVSQDSAAVHPLTLIDLLSDRPIIRGENLGPDGLTYEWVDASLLSVAEGATPDEESSPGIGLRFFAARPWCDRLSRVPYLSQVASIPMTAHISQTPIVAADDTRGQWIYLEHEGKDYPIGRTREGLCRGSSRPVCELRVSIRSGRFLMEIYSYQAQKIIGDFNQPVFTTNIPRPLSTEVTDGQDGTKTPLSALCTE